MTLKVDKKEGLHPRNRHNKRYDFPELIIAHAELAEFVEKNKFGDLSVDFFNPKAVKCLNKALLAAYYDINYWDIPENALTPPIPGRADYIHYIADLLGVKSKGKIRCLDVGVGANCIYPIIGVKEYGWEFVGSDTELNSVRNAQKIVDNNSVLQGKVELRHQINKNHIFEGIISENERLDVTICNPPFHSSQAEAEKGTLRKLRNLRGAKVSKSSLNFGGKSNELWCKGGELGFISIMIRESSKFRNNVGWFTTLVSKEDNLKALRHILSDVNVKELRVIEMSQGNKKSRILAWRY